MQKLAITLLLTPVLCTLPCAADASKPSCKLKVIRKTVPTLPKFVRGVRSELIVQLRVNPDGHVAHADLLRGTGNSEVDTSVIHAIRHEWQYKPLHAGCAPIDEVISVKLQYQDRLRK